MIVEKLCFQVSVHDLKNYVKNILLLCLVLLVQNHFYDNNLEHLIPKSKNLEYPMKSIKKDFYKAIHGEFLAKLLVRYTIVASHSYDDSCDSSDV